MTAISHSTYRRSSFSLVELIVVIAILALLATLLNPSLRRIKMESESMICKNNMRTLASVSYLYRDDRDGIMVNQSFSKDLDPYLGQLGGNPFDIQRNTPDLRCLTALSRHAPGTDRRNDNMRSLAISSTFNNANTYMIGRKRYYPPLRYNQMVAPAQTAMYMDGALAKPTPYWHSTISKSRINSTAEQATNMIHENLSINVIFTDQHIEVKDHLDIDRIDREDRFWESID